MPDIILSSNNIGSVVSFSTRAPGVLGSGWSRVTILSVLDMDDASRYLDPRSLHQAVFPSLPIEVPNNPAKYTYLKVKSSNGTITAIGLPWIDPSTVVIHNELIVDFRVSGTSPEMVTRFREALIVAGAVNVEVIPVA